MIGRNPHKMIAPILCDTYNTQKFRLDYPLLAGQFSISMIFYFLSNDFSSDLKEHSITFLLVNDIIEALYTVSMQTPSQIQYRLRRGGFLSEYG